MVTNEELEILLEWIKINNNSHSTTKLVLITEKDISIPKTIQEMLNKAKVKIKEEKEKEKKKLEREAKRLKTLESKRKEKELKVLEELQKKYSS